jgi:hypothetical protein
MPFISNVPILTFLLIVTVILLAYPAEVISRYVTRLSAACPHLPGCVNFLPLFTHAYSYYDFFLESSTTSKCYILEFLFVYQRTEFLHIGMRS